MVYLDDNVVLKEKEIDYLINKSFNNICEIKFYIFNHEKFDKYKHIIYEHMNILLLIIIDIILTSYEYLDINRKDLVLENTSYLSLSSFLSEEINNLYLYSDISYSFNIIFDVPLIVYQTLDKINVNNAYIKDGDYKISIFLWLLMCDILDALYESFNYKYDFVSAFLRIAYEKKINGFIIDKIRDNNVKLK